MLNRLKWVLCAAFLLVSSPAPGDVSVDTTPHKPLRIGFKFGLNQATLTSDDDSLPDDIFSGRLGLAFGGSVRYAVSGLIAIRPELLYMSKGAKVLIESSGRGHISYSYFTVPVLVEVAVPPRRSLQVTLVAGPAVSMLHNATSGREFDGVDVSIKDETTPFDVGLVLGGGLIFEIAPGLSSTIDIRYEHGLRDTDGETDDDRVHNRMWSFLFGLEY